MSVTTKEVVTLRMNNFTYFLKEGVDNLFTNKIVTFTTLITVILSLIVTGAFQAVSINTMFVSNEIKSNFEFNIYIKDTVSNDMLPSVGDKIKEVAMVNDIRLKTKSETFLEVKEKVGEDDVLKGLSEENNPFRDCFIITIEDLTMAMSILDEIKKIPEVDSTPHNLDASEQIEVFSGRMWLFSIISYILLAALCLSIISNIINLSIFSRRKQINIMKYVGATDWFIKFPFIIEGVLIGLLGALIATGLLIYAYSFIFSGSGQMFGIYLLSPAEVFKVVVSLNSLYGILVGAVGAIFAVNKHLKV